MRRKRRKGGIIWIFRPPKPMSPHQEQRAAEFTLILELGVWLVESWVERAEREGNLSDAPIGLLLAATRWFCLLSLPDSRLDLFHGASVLSRVDRPLGITISRESA